MEDALPLPERTNKDSPLKESIMLIKRHRDIYFNHTDILEYRTPSIIITTLFGKYYKNSGLKNPVHIIKKISKNLLHFTQNDIVYQIPNPVNSSENFADKINKNPKSLSLFKEWVTELNLDIDNNIFISKIYESTKVISV
jgi:hypothetical protein